MPKSQGWTITHYCSACNGTKGSVLGLRDHVLRVGDCAIHNSHGFKFGRSIKINGMILNVVDACGKIKTVDIWQGKKQKCTCNYKSTGHTLYWEQ